MDAIPGVAEVHDLHVWSLSSEVRALSAHIVVVGHPSLEEAQAIGDRVKSAVTGPFTIAHTTLELECERCSDDEADPCLMDVLPSSDQPGGEPRPAAGVAGGHRPAPGGGRRPGPGGGLPGLVRPAGPGGRPRRMGDEPARRPGRSRLRRPGRRRWPGWSTGAVPDRRWPGSRAVAASDEPVTGETSFAIR